MSKLQGGRPPSLKICRKSHKILNPATAVPSMPVVNRSQPVILYMQSPKIIHAEVEDFRGLVQRLTGNSSTSDTRSCTTRSEIFTADDDSSDVKMSSHPDEPEDDNIWLFSTDDKPCNSNPTSLENYRNQEMKSRASRPDDADPAEPEVTSSGVSGTAPILIESISPFSPNFLPRPQQLSSPSNFKDVPLFTPDSNNFNSVLSQVFFQSSSHIACNYLDRKPQ